MMVSALLIKHIEPSVSGIEKISRGLFTVTNMDFDFNPDSDPIPVLSSWDWNLNLTPCRFKCYALHNVAIWFAVRIRIGIGIRQCE